MDCKIDTSKYGIPMPWIGLYITAASVACSIAMLGDFIWGIHRKRLWFPCKFFSLNATSLTLIAIAAKLPVDLNNPMPAAREQLAKLSGTAFLCITMANFMTSVANMKESHVILDIIPLGILVITVVVNVCIQLGTGVIHTFLPEHIITMCFLLILLMFTCNAALELTLWKPLIGGEYQKIHQSISREESHHGIILNSVANFKRDVKRYWMAVLCTDPQYRSYSDNDFVASDILCLLEAGTLIQALVRTLKQGSAIHDCRSEQASSSSDYRWSIEFILFSQVVAVLVGVLGPLYRILQKDHVNVRGNFGEFDENIDGDTLIEVLRQLGFHGLMKLFKDAWQLMSNRISLTLLDCDFDHVRFGMIRRRSCRRFIHCSKNIIVGILTCNYLAGSAVSALLSQLTWVLGWASRPLSLKMARTILFPFTKVSLVTELEKSFDTATELRDFLKDAEGWALGITDGLLLFRLVNANRWIRKESKKSLTCLTNLVKVSSACGRAELVRRLGPLVFHEDESSVEECWALLVVNLSSIAVLMPCAETTSPTKSDLLCGVGEGLKYVRFLDKHSKAPVNIRKAANTVWEDVELSHRWFDADVSKFDSMRNDPMAIIRCLEKMGKSYMKSEDRFTQLGNMEKSPMAVAGKSMSTICRTIRKARLLYRFSNADEAYICLHNIICNVLAVRLMDLRQALHVECYCNAFEGKEDHVEEVAYLLSKAENIVEVLEKECHHDDAVVNEWKS